MDTSVVIAGFATWHDGHDTALTQGEDLPLVVGDDRPGRGIGDMSGHECYHCKQWVEEGESHDCWTTTEATLTADPEHLAGVGDLIIDCDDGDDLLSRLGST